MPRKRRFPQQLFISFQTAIFFKSRGPHDFMAVVFTSVGVCFENLGFLNSCSFHFRLQFSSKVGASKTSVSSTAVHFISDCNFLQKQGDHPCIVRDGPTKRPQYMRISRLITVTYLPSSHSWLKLWPSCCVDESCCFPVGERWNHVLHEDTECVIVWFKCVIRSGVRQGATEPGKTRATPFLGRY